MPSGVMNARLFIVYRMCAHQCCPASPTRGVPTCGDSSATRSSDNFLLVVCTVFLRVAWRYIEVLLSLGRSEYGRGPLCLWLDWWPPRLTSMYESGGVKVPMAPDSIPVPPNSCGTLGLI